jgi:hypothetical protein
MPDIPHASSEQPTTHSLKVVGRSNRMRNLPAQPRKTKKKPSTSHNKNSKKNKSGKKNKNKRDGVQFGKNCKRHDGGCHVKFSDAQEVHSVVPRLSSFSPEDRQNMWFEGEDFQDFVDEALKTVEKMEQGKELRDKKYSALGLENYTEEGRALKTAFREDAYDAVMYEQEEQYQLGRRDSGLLADAYHRVSVESHKRAICLALRLRRDVIKYLTNDDINVKHKKKKRTRAQKRRSSF